jgi:hypothetical protein
MPLNLNRSKSTYKTNDHGQRFEIVPLGIDSFSARYASVTPEPFTDA